MKRLFLLLVALMAFALPSSAQINIGAIEVGEASLKTVDVYEFRFNGYYKTASLSHYGYHYYLRLPSSHPGEAYYFYLGIGAKTAKTSIEGLLSIFATLKDKTQVVTVCDAEGEEFVFNQQLKGYLNISNPEFNPHRHYLDEFGEEEGKHKYKSRVGKAFIKRKELQKCIEALDNVLKDNPNG